MRAERGEEAAMLLNAYQQAAVRDADRLRQRRRAIRTLFGVVGAVALFVGCIAAVDVFAINGVNGGDTMTLEVTTGDNEAIEMESQFGWNSIGYGWCSIKSSTWCMFSKDKEKCKESIQCYKNRVQASAGNGSGSGDFGNVTVGDSSSDAEVGSDVDVPEDDNTSDEAPASPDEAPEAPVDNPTQPLDLPAGGGGDASDEEGEDTMGGED
ncbi:unnamed protein product [Phytophthora lilii]|uniref:Unnamed protein product n=1 Tax=Phytophthora lilii TaxID=2077276 RepID=A0A9W6TPD8_9STRA|nr:unnamed protein product [Phytophthora lilii]